MNYFFTADTHFNHPEIIRHCGRPFLSIQEMNETIIKNWNLKVGPKDLVYHLGDFCFGNRKDHLNYLSRLNGRVILILGNHDSVGDPKNYGFSEKHKMLEVKIEKQHITLCHYAMRVWAKSHYDAWMLYGHSHNCLPPEGKTWDVGVDANDFTPLSFEEIKKIMEARPSNLNWLEKLPGYNQKEYEDYRSTEMS
jgi:calcineurin-like phosphoesterase family protein